MLYSCTHIATVGVKGLNEGSGTAVLYRKLYRAFFHAGPTVSLPDELRNSNSFDGFKRYLKTIFFSVVI